MKHPPSETKQLKEQMLRNGDTDNELFNEPYLPECLEFFIEAFWDLSTCRAFGMSQGPIPVTAIIQYCMFRECGKELSRDVMEYVRLLDSLYLKHQEQKEKEKSK